MTNQSHHLFLDQLGAPPSRATTFPNVPNTCIIIILLPLPERQCM
jgi:hypothetical protein